MLKKVILTLTVISIGFAHAQTKWTSTNTFKTDVFVKNSGQFNKWVSSPDAPVKFGVMSADKVFFTSQGVIFRLETIEQPSEEERDKLEKSGVKEMARTMETNFVTMTWQGCNADVNIEESEETAGYYTYGDKGADKIKSKGYKKITYKNIYPQIDAEYTLPSQGGIKYKLILHPGADVSVVKMVYDGDVKKLKIDKDGNVLIVTPMGNIIDHAPQSFYEAGNAPITSSFQIKGRTVSFNLPANISNQTVIIDPWTAVPTSLTTNNEAYDLEHDAAGNVYIQGGSVPFKISKYSPAGAFLWTFTYPAGWASGTYYSKFCILPNSGTTFTGEGFVGGSNPMVMKIGNNGILQITSIPFVGSNEIWLMFYNPCSAQLFAFGGGTNSQNNMRTIADTNLTSSTNLNFNGYPGGCCNDIASVKMDYNGDFYALMSSGGGTPNVSGQLMKSLFTSLYAPPPFWDVASGYSMNETIANGYLFGSSVRANTLALNNAYLYSYDGLTLKAWNKATGANLGSIVVNGAYSGGQNRSHDGIAVDECNNVYVGGTNMVHTFTFNGSVFTPGATITTNITGEVFDIALNGTTGDLYVCGNGFVTNVIAANSVNCTASGIFTLSANIVSATCSTAGSATVIITGGSPPYNVIWNTIPPQTGLTISNVPAGTYTCTIIDAGCITQSFVDSVTVTSVGGVTATATTTIATCGNNNGTATVTAVGSPPYTYLWSNGQTTQTATGLAVGTYSVAVTDNLGCTTSQIVNVTSNNSVTATTTTTPTGCTTSVGTATITGAGGAPPYTYLWSNSQTTQTATGLPNGVVSCIITDNNGCSQLVYVTITSTNPLTASISSTPTGCTTSIGTATVVPGNGALPYTYLWSNSQTTATATGLGLGPVNCTITDNNGCTINQSINIVSNNPITMSLSSTITGCAVNNGTATANPANGTTPYTYSWTGGQTTQTATGLGVGTYTCIVTDANGCTNTQSVAVGTNNPVTLSLASTMAGCTVNNGTATATALNGLLPYTYSWTGGQTTMTATGLAAGTYTCIATDANGCAQTLSVVVQSQNNVTLALSMTQANCIAANGTATAAPANGIVPFTYLWSDGQTTSTATGLAAGSYTCTVTDAVGCAHTDSIAVTVNNPVQLSITNTQTICTAFTGTATANPSLGALPYTYLWIPGGQTSQTANNLPTGGYVCTVTDANGCSQTNSTTISQTSPPIALALPVMSTVISGQSVFLTATGGTTYHWSPAEGLNCVNCPSPTATPANTTTYCVVVTDNNGCTDSTCIQIEVKCNANLLDVLVPTAFSPNNDGLNDELCIPINMCILDFELDIFDRWGEKVFTTSDINHCWDGTYKGANLGTAGFVYTFTAKLSDGKDFKQKGTISLIK